MFYSSWVVSVFVYGVSIFFTGFVFSAFENGFFKSKAYLKHKAPWSPPNWLFGIAWTILYCLLSVSFVLIMEDHIVDADNRNQMIILFLVQLLFNFLWTPVFCSDPLQGLLTICLCISSLIFMCILGFNQRTNSYVFIATCLLSPYLLWILYAFTLNLYFVWSKYILTPLKDRSNNKLKPVMQL